jgi:hypothetical protein
VSVVYSAITGVGFLLAADSQSTIVVWVSGLPLGSLTRFYLALLTSSDNFSSFEGSFSEEKTCL